MLSAAYNSVYVCLPSEVRPFPLQVANNRYSFFGKRDVCQLQPDNKYADRFLA